MWSIKSVFSTPDRTSIRAACFTGKMWGVKNVFSTLPQVNRQDATPRNSCY